MTNSLAINRRDSPVIPELVEGQSPEPVEGLAKHHVNFKNR